ncbi:MAG: hypothetical protein H0V04_01465, partial [Chloroflexi bacterium]|nr:hypothetical protein [Chloroflexota bacterium]
MSTSPIASGAAVTAVSAPPSPPAPPGPPVRRLQAPTPRVALLIGAIVVIGVIFYMARGSLGPFVLGLVLIYVMDPAVER